MKKSVKTKITRVRIRKCQSLWYACQVRIGQIKYFKDLVSSRHLRNFDDNVELSNRIDPLRVDSASWVIYLFYLLRRFVDPSHLWSDLHFHSAVM